MAYIRKKGFAHPKSRTGRLAKALCVSIYPNHTDVIRRREAELDLPKSILIQLLLDVEERDGIIRQEIQRRMKWARQCAGH
jgi:hypothetical protein